MEHYWQIHKFIHPINLQQIVSQISGQFLFTFIVPFFSGCSLAATSTTELDVLMVLWFYVWEHRGPQLAVVLV